MGTPDGGPAFPVGEASQFQGMSLRDYIAIKALPQVIANTIKHPNLPTTVAAWAYEIADAMLTEREK